ncbi:MAG: hypothetical protein SFV19_03855, partial [Rhodospirillaceae bacterium]|nr:hypothetical protein [Rhodospirillaceae bacterium]
AGFENPKAQNKIARFRGATPQNPAISNQHKRLKPNPPQRLMGFLTGDSLKPGAGQAFQAI